MPQRSRARRRDGAPHLGGPSLHVAAPVFPQLLRPLSNRAAAGLRHPWVSRGNTPGEAMGRGNSRRRRDSPYRSRLPVPEARSVGRPASGPQTGDRAEGLPHPGRAASSQGLLTTGPSHTDQATVPPTSSVLRRACVWRADAPRQTRARPSVLALCTVSMPKARPRRRLTPWPAQPSVLPWSRPTGIPHARGARLVERERARVTRAACRTPGSSPRADSVARVAQPRAGSSGPHLDSLIPRTAPAHSSRRFPQPSAELPKKRQSKLPGGSPRISPRM